MNIRIDYEFVEVYGGLYGSSIKVPYGALEIYKAFRGIERHKRTLRVLVPSLARKKTVWFLVGNGLWDYYWRLYRDYHRDPFPYSLLRTRQKTAAKRVMQASLAKVAYSTGIGGSSLSGKHWAVHAMSVHAMCQSSMEVTSVPPS